MANPHTAQSDTARGSGTLARLQRIKQWQVAHKYEQPLEYETWDAMLTVWVMGLIGWLPAFAFNAVWAYPLCVLALYTPGLYIRLRRHAHRAGYLRCDWLDEAG